MVSVEMLAPAAVLVLWSLIMLVWMAATRFATFKTMGVNLGSEQSRGRRGSDLDGVLPGKVMWKAHNYNHLMEQPTVFYPAVIILALVGPGPFDIVLAWAYVVLRIVHSLWQSLFNSIPVRFMLFALSTLCLLALSIHAVIRVLHDAI